MAFKGCGDTRFGFETEIGSEREAPAGLSPDKPLGFIPETTRSNRGMIRGEHSQRVDALGEWLPNRSVNGSASD